VLQPLKSRPQRFAKILWMATDVANISEERVASVTRVADLADALFAESERACAAKAAGKLLGAPIGLPGVDRELGGYWPPGLHVLHAGPGAGKTAFAIQATSAVAAQRCAGLYVSCEMRALEIFRRIIARETGIFKGRLRPGEMEPSRVLTAARKAAAANPGFAIVDATLAPAPLPKIREWLEDLRARLETEHSFLVIDSVHAWAGSIFLGENISEYDQLTTAMAQLLSFATQADIPILLIAERNRLSMKDGGMSAGAGSRKLEYSTESVIELSRDLDEAPSPDGEVSVELRFNKNRNGAPGVRVPLLFKGATMTFRENQGFVAMPPPAPTPIRRRNQA
jgi:replicative DNA helicase